MAQSRHPSRLARFLLFSLLLFVVLYGVAGFLVLPWWLERNLPEQLAERMGWQAEVEGVSVNPFILAVEAERLSAQDGDGESVLRFDRLMVDLNALQLVRGIIGFEAIRLEEPFVRLDPVGYVCFAIVPFVKSPEAQDKSGRLYQRLLELNQTLLMAKFSIDDDLDVVLSVEYPSEELDRSEFDDALDVLSYYADRHYDELRALIA
ncbi:YbjN domain-containing protein [Marinobacter sp.]|uniref:DUF748 domain-containing protein n=1 Tax=Marinobacter sp. TaxID=50741 RepID=UPI0035C7120A